MKILISEATKNFYHSDLTEFDPSIEIFSVNPNNPENPAWDSAPDCDAFFLSYEFMFAVRDNPYLSEPLINLSKRMKFIQTGFAGMDSPVSQALLRETNASLSNASGIHAIPIAHYVFAQMLRWNKRIDQHSELQKMKQWTPLGGDGELTDKTLVILGYGGIGREIGKLGKAFGMNITGIRSKPSDCSYADQVLGLEHFKELLPLIDYLVLALPDSEETRNIVDKNILEQLNKSAMLINVGRGTAINEEDLAHALDTNQIAAAALDTTKDEPLEKSSSLWTAKNCFISAHDSAHSVLSIPRTFHLFLENLKNIKNNQPIKNLCEL